MDSIRRLWRQPDHFDWLSAYLAARNLQRLTRSVLAAILAALAVAALLTLGSSAGPSGALTRTALISAALVCVAMALGWLVRWPSRRQSLLFVAVTTACVATICAVQPTPTASLQAATGFAAVAGYAALFHTCRSLSLVLATAVCTAVVAAVQIGVDGDAFSALSKLLILSIPVMAVPVSAHILVHFLGMDAVKSDSDPLTKLPNRRGFYRSMRMLAAESIGARSSALSAVMIDLDAFKRVNDTAGHAAGDQALIEVADILRHSRRGDSVIARIGGEEFVVGVVGPREDAIGLAERLCREVAETPWPITASVGVATAATSRVPTDDLRMFLQGLVESADRAMYTAKRAGGNQVWVSDLLPPPTETPIVTAAPDMGEDYDEVPVANPAARRTTAMNGSVPWMAADRNLSRADATRTRAAASMDPAPAKTRAAPTAVPPEVMNPTPTPATIAKKKL